MRGQFPIFAGERFSNLSKQKIDGIKKEIHGEEEDYILNVNENEYQIFLLKKYQIGLLEIDFEGLTMESYEGKIRGNQTGLPRFFIDGNNEFPQNVFVFYLPFSGDPNLLSFRPNRSLMWSFQISIKGNSICFELRHNLMSDGLNEIIREKESILKNIKIQLGYLSNDIEIFNSSLLPVIRETFISTKQRYLTRREMEAFLGVPIRKKKNTPETFSIPKPELRKRIKVKPVVYEEGFSPEPSLDESTYFQILKLIDDIGLNFERLPSLYVGKDEEYLRDHILMTIDPHFEGTTSGETFHKKGKTDIQLRYDSSVVFIAECKFWRGAKSFLDTIDQLLGYLTWRDSKSAIVLFVKNKQISKVLVAIKETASKHDNYLDFVGMKGEHFFTYRFHINGDRNREVKLAVLIYHLP